MIYKRYSFRKLRKLWLLYLFLLFFSFFMFAICINVYLQNLHDWQIKKKNWESHKELRERNSKNIVVAHYIGQGNIFGNISKEETNEINFKPVEGEGALGKPVAIPPRDSFKMQRLFKINSYNLLASDSIPLNRTLQDYRSNRCQMKLYPQDLPNTSVVIVFHNEAWSVLLRTIWSVINRTPERLLKEIILVDDASDREYLKFKLENYIEELAVDIKVIRLDKREGIVPARLAGANAARGDVLTFLDAHCECSEGWAEPLLSRIKENRHTVICPVIDVISDDNFSYTKAIESHWGAFNWQLHFRWFVLNIDPNEEDAKFMYEPLKTPAMAGGLFSVERNYFFEIGAYDPEMKIWGGENVEMSFRIWQCGGQIEIHPCSHVGHVFRKTTPYTFPGGMAEVLGANLGRAALVWMDEWSDFYFMFNSPVGAQLRNELNVTERLELRKRLNCKSFSWYLKNIWPENFFPAKNRFFGKIVWLNGNSEITNVYKKFISKIPGKFLPKKWSNVFQTVWKNHQSLLEIHDFQKDSCLRANLEDGTKHISDADIGNCNPDERSQDLFVITEHGQIMTNENMCLDFHNSLSKNSSNIRMFHCNKNARQIWLYNMNDQQIIHKNTGLCLTIKKTVPNGTIIRTEKCEDGNDIHQKWGLVPIPWRF